MISNKRKIDLVWNDFLGMVDTHCEWILERDEKKKKLFKAVHDYQTEIFEEKVRKIYE